MQVAMPSDREIAPPSYNALLDLLSSVASGQYDQNLNHNAESADSPETLPDSPCCGGYIDCGLVEEEDGEPTVHQEDTESLQNSPSVSQLRTQGTGIHDPLGQHTVIDNVRGKAESLLRP